MSKSSIARRADLQAALKQFRKKGETIALQDLATLWGVTKARFINLRAQITGFPEPVGKDGNALLYQAKPALEALLQYETRNDGVTARKASKIARILGATASEPDDDMLPPSEMLALARARAEIHKQLQEQGLLVLFADVQETMADVFGFLSNILNKLSDSVDPNGRLPGPVRGTLDALGNDLLLRTYKDLNDMLADDVDRDTSRTTPARAQPARPGAAKARRVSKKRNPPRARRAAARRGDTD
jgi:hypothetical protein